MPTFQGEKLIPSLATSEQKEALSKILKLKAEVKAKYEAMDLLIKSLPQEVAISAHIMKEDVEGFRTFVIGKPKGHFVTYKELDLVLDQKTTKEDIKIING